MFLHYLDEDEKTSSSTPKLIKSYFIDKPHVLLIDRHADELEETADTFELNSWRVTKTSRINDACDILKNKPRVPNKMPKIDVVCMSVRNVYFPEPKLKQLRAVQRLAATRDVPVVILTEYYPLFETIWRMFKEAGAVAQKTMPVDHFDVNDLLKKMEDFEEDKKKRTKRNQILDSKFSPKIQRTLNLG